MDGRGISETTRELRGLGEMANLPANANGEGAVLPLPALDDGHLPSEV